MLAMGCSSRPLADGPEEQRLVDVRGAWRAEHCQGVPQQDGSTTYLARDIRFADAEWELSLTTHGDPACETPLMTVAVHGDFAVERASANLDDTFEARFGRNEVAITAESADMAAFLTAEGCGAEAWEVRVPQSVADGCLFLPPVSDCPAEYDLVRRRGDHLWFGVRQGSLCSADARPRELDDMRFIRVE